MIRGGMVRLPVADLERAMRFYIETLGMKLVEETAEVAVIDAGEGFRIGLTKTPSAIAPITIALYPKMPLTEAVAILENRGVAFERDARFHDPDGHVLALVMT